MQIVAMICFTFALCCGLVTRVSAQEQPRPEQEQAEPAENTAQGQSETQPEPGPKAEEKNKIEVKADPGDIVVIIMDESGNLIAGVEVKITLPGKDGSLKKQWNFTNKIADGGEDDADKKKNGVVICRGKEMKEMIKTGQEFSVAIELKGFSSVDSIIKGYKTSEPNRVEIVMKKTVK